jgi:hypothetical protein
MRYQINSTGQVIIADQAFMDAQYPGDYTLVAETPPTPPVDPCLWLLDIGPFFDRFGAVKMAVLTSTDAGVKAILQDVQIRKWIDLQNAEVASSLAYIGSVVPSLTPAIRTAILTTPVSSVENMALRKVYFS